MALEPKDIKKIAHLARLAVSPEDIVSLCKDLSNILSFIEQLDQVNTSHTSPMAHPYEATQPLRKDEVTEPNQRELFQGIAPQTQAGLYIVPQFVEHD